MRFKKITIIGLAIFYSFFLFILSSDTLVSDILQVRQNIVIHSKEKETIFFSKQVWNTIESKEEFKYENNYYDVSHIVIYKNFVKVEVVKDVLELVIKDISKNLNTKDKKSTLLSFKKSIVIYYSKATPIGFVFGSAFLKDNYYYSNSIKNRFPTSLFRPPCFS